MTPAPHESSEFFVTTVHRCAPPDEGGGILKVDRASGRILAEAKIAPKDPDIIDDANPRGGIRGARGVIRLDADHIMVANYHSLIVYTNDLKVVDKHSHPLMSGNHAIFLDGDIVWVTSTSIDMLVGYNLKTRSCDVVYDATTFDSVQEMGVKSRGLDPEADYRTDPSVVRGDFTHLNSVLKIGDRLYVLLNKYGAILELTHGEVMVRHDLLRGGHDLVYVPERNQIAVNDTVTQSILMFDAQSFDLVDRFKLASLKGAPLWLTTQKIPLYAQKLRTRLLKKRNVNSSPLFMRGLTYMPGHLVSGISPAAVFVTDINTRKIVGQYRLSRDTNETVYGVFPA